MFAIVKTGGKQYKAVPDGIIKTEMIDRPVGEEFDLEEVLMFQDEQGKVKIGAPMIAGASVAVKVVSQGRDPKIIVFKKKRRQNYRRKAGHRQYVTRLKVLGIKAAN